MSDIKSYLLDHVANSSVVNVQVWVQESEATGAVSYEVDFKFKPLEFLAKSENEKEFSESFGPLGHSSAFIDRDTELRNKCKGTEEVADRGLVLSFTLQVYGYAGVRHGAISGNYYLAGCISFWYDTSFKWADGGKIT